MAYEDGFLQLRTRPKLQGRYYLKGLEETKEQEFAVRLRSGQSFRIPVYESGAESFEIYALFADKREYLPPGDAIDTLPYGTGRVDILGPIDFFLYPLYGPVRTDEQIGLDLSLVRDVSARFTVPDQNAQESLQVTWKYVCSGQVSAEASKLDLRYVLGVRPMYPVKPDPDKPGYFVKSVSWGAGQNIWIQSSPWKIEDTSFEGKLAVFGVEQEAHPCWEFELWLIAIRPGIPVELQTGQSWLASALPEGCVRAASIKVIKIADTVHDESRPNLQVNQTAVGLDKAVVLCCEITRGKISMTK
jgi:hypothetical protein